MRLRLKDRQQEISKEPVVVIQSHLLDKSNDEARIKQNVN